MSGMVEALELEAVQLFRLSARSGSGGSSGGGGGGGGKSSAGRARTGRSPRPGKAPAAATGGHGKATLDRTVRGHTEVVAKVTSVKRDAAGIASSVDYLSREGELAIETQSGVEVKGKEENRNLVESWARGSPPIGDEVTARREAYALVLSMPEGTPVEGVREAARGFAQREFGAHRHVSVLHEDTDHVHVHMLVRAAAADGRRLDLEKGDFERWRRTFAEELRERGIEANATSRAVRGVVLPRERDAIYRMGLDEENGVERKTPSHVLAARLERNAKAVRDELGLGDGYPSRESMLAERERVEGHYERIARIYEEAGPEHQEDANRVRRHVAGFERIEGSRASQRLRSALGRLPDRGAALMEEARQERDRGRENEGRVAGQERAGGERVVQKEQGQGRRQDGPEIE